MKSKRGDVVMFPDSNSLTAKRRPAIVIQADGLPTQLSQVIVAMISSMARIGQAFRAPIPMKSSLNRGTGLRTDSVIMLDNLATVHDRYVDKKIGTLADMTVINSALRVVLCI